MFITNILSYGVTVGNLGCGGLKFAGKDTELGGKKILSKVTQTQKDKKNMYSLISGF